MPYEELFKLVGGQVQKTDQVQSMNMACNFHANDLRLNSGRWDDTQQSAYALRDVGAGVPTLTQVGNTSIWLPLFAVNDRVVFNIQFPHDFLQGNVTIYPHIHWIGSATDANNAVKFQVTYQWVNIGDNLAENSSVITMTDYAIANQVILSTGNNVSKVGAKVSSMFMGELRRVTNGANDYAGNVSLAFFDIHYQKDSIGSDAIISKDGV